MERVLVIFFFHSPCIGHASVSCVVGHILIFVGGEGDCLFCHLCQRQLFFRHCSKVIILALYCRCVKRERWADILLSWTKLLFAWCLLLNGKTIQLLMCLKILLTYLFLVLLFPGVNFQWAWCGGVV